MMPYDMCTKDVLKDIFAGRKKLIKSKDMQYISTPRYDEISVKHLYDKLLKLEGMAEHFPSKYGKGRQCDREFLFNIANTLHPGVMAELLAYAHEHRHGVSSEKQSQEAILATEAWAAELKAMPYFSKVSVHILTKFLFSVRERWWHCSSRRQRSGWPPSQEGPLRSQTSSRGSSCQMVPSRTRSPCKTSSTSPRSSGISERSSSPRCWRRSTRR
jgi:hypothetical protein